MRSYPPQLLAFELEQTPGFVCPPRIASLRDSVEIDLARGAQMLSTVVMGKEYIAYGQVEDFIGNSVPGGGMHRFSGSSLGEEPEVSQGLSNVFSKIIGLSFMEAYAETT